MSVIEALSVFCGYLGTLRNSGIRHPEKVAYAQLVRILDQSLYQAGFTYHAVASLICRVEVAVLVVEMVFNTREYGCEYTHS